MNFTVVGMEKSKEDRDRLWSQAVQELYNGRCIICQSSWNTAAHHVVGRGHLETRWLLENGIWICGDHHSYLHNLIFKEMYIVHSILIGQDTLKALFDLAKLTEPNLTTEERYFL